jgi:hypothetical protein
MMKRLRQNLSVKGKNASLLLNRAEFRETLIFLLLLLLLPTQLGKHWWPDYALIRGFRVDYLSPTLYLTDVLIAGLLLHWLLRSRPRISRALLPYGLFLLFLILSLFTAAVPPAGFYTVLKVAEYIFFAWYVAQNLSTPLLRRLIPSVFVVTVTLESILALAQVLFKGSLGGAFYWVGERAISSLTPGAATVVLNGEVFLRPYGTFSHPNVLAGFLVISMSYIWIQRKVFDPQYRNGLVTTILGLGTLGLLVTLSRVAIVIWAAFLAFTLFRWTKQWWQQENLHRLRTLAVLLSTLLLFCLLAFPLLMQVGTRFLSSSPGEESFIVRADLTGIAAQVILAHPVLGVGPGNFLFAAAPLKSSETPLFFAVQPVHNIFLLVWAETGTLGMLLLLWFLAQSYRHGTRGAKLLLALVVLLGMVDHYFLTLQQGQLLFSFVLGYCWIPQARRVIPGHSIS